MNFSFRNPGGKFFAENWRSHWLGILGLIILFIALRWNNFDAALNRDEGEYAYSALLLEHGMAHYEHAFVQKPPMVFYSYALSDFFLPHVFWGPRLLASAFVAFLDSFWSTTAGGGCGNARCASTVIILKWSFLERMHFCHK